MTDSNKGPLESINVRVEKSLGEEIKKLIDASKAVLDSMGSTITKKDKP